MYRWSNIRIFSHQMYLSEPISDRTCQSHVITLLKSIVLGLEVVIHIQSFNQTDCIISDYNWSLVKLRSCESHQWIISQQFSYSTLKFLYVIGKAHLYYILNQNKTPQLIGFVWANDLQSQVGIPSNTILFCNERKKIKINKKRPGLANIF